MVMKVDVMVRALRAVRRETSHVVLLGPGGTPLSQDGAASLAQKEHLVLLCGHYEGVDDRVRSFVDQEISIGDYVLTGGELPALVVVDSVARLLPGVLGNKDSAREESFSEGLLEYPQYTRPAEFEGQKVPEVLASGDHGAIAAWRTGASLERTRRCRPDLLPAVGESSGESED
jgi:tRNA (guanine37-N1)-methyltransferase